MVIINRNEIKQICLKKTSIGANLILDIQKRVNRLFEDEEEKTRKKTLMLKCLKISFWLRISIIWAQIKPIFSVTSTLLFNPNYTDICDS